MAQAQKKPVEVTANTMAAALQQAGVVGNKVRQFKPNQQELEELFPEFSRHRIRRHINKGTLPKLMNAVEVEPLEGWKSTRACKQRKRRHAKDERCWQPAWVPTEWKVDARGNYLPEYDWRGDRFNNEERVLASIRRDARQRTFGVTVHGSKLASDWETCQSEYVPVDAHWFDKKSRYIAKKILKQGVSENFSVGDMLDNFAIAKGADCKVKSGGEQFFGGGDDDYSVCYQADDHYRLEVDIYDGCTNPDDLETLEIYSDERSFASMGGQRTQFFIATADMRVI